jgi:hypothetical protein
MASSDDLPDDIDALKAALLAANDRAAQVEAALAVARAKVLIPREVARHSGMISPGIPI